MLSLCCVCSFKQQKNEWVFPRITFSLPKPYLWHIAASSLTVEVLDLFSLSLWFKCVCFLRATKPNGTASQSLVEYQPIPKQWVPFSGCHMSSVVLQPLFLQVGREVTASHRPTILHDPLRPSPKLKIEKKKKIGMLFEWGTVTPNKNSSTSPGHLHHPAILPCWEFTFPGPAHLPSWNSENHRLCSLFSCLQSLGTWAK